MKRIKSELWNQHIYHLEFHGGSLSPSLIMRCNPNSRNWLHMQDRYYRIDNIASRYDCIARARARVCVGTKNTKKSQFVWELNKCLHNQREIRLERYIWINREHSCYSVSRIKSPVLSRVNKSHAFNYAISI